MTEEIEIDEEEEFVSEEQDIEDKYNLQQISYVDYFVITFSIIFFALYYTIPTMYAFIQKNLTYINQNIDMLFFYYLVVVIPFYSYYFLLAFRIIRHFWTEFSVVKLRIRLTILRFNIIYFGIITISFCLLTGTPFIHWGTFLVGFLVLGILNYWFLDYEEIKEDQILYHHLRKKGEKEPVPIHPIILVIFPVIFILIAIYLWGNVAFKDAIDGFWIQHFQPDLPLIIMFVLTSAFSLFWWLISFIMIVVLSAIEHYKNKLSMYLKLIVVLCILYFFIKMIIFNISNELDQPYGTLSSMAMTGVGTLFIKFAKKKVIKTQNE